jgi:enoyl-[acyl-carrier protein] reductase III
MQLTREFTGKKALITGGTKGLGLTTARLLAELGADVYLSYRSDEASAKKAVEAMRGLGVRSEAIACDLSEEGAADKLFDALAAHTNSLDIYVHNAAATAFKDLCELKPHHIDKTFNITVKSFILGMQRAEAMMPNGGAVVTVSGMDTLKAVPRRAARGAAKSALETLTAYFAHELAFRKIRVNSVNPGFFRTESTEKYLGEAFEIVNKAFTDVGPLKREAKMEEIAQAILFLCSERSSWFVGQTLKVDGGFDFALPMPG